MKSLFFFVHASLITTCILISNQSNAEKIYSEYVYGVAKNCYQEHLCKTSNCDYPTDQEALVNLHNDADVIKTRVHASSYTVGALRNFYLSSHPEGQVGTICLESWVSAQVLFSIPAN